MRISDWSSDVCSSDLAGSGAGELRPHPELWVRLLAPAAGLEGVAVPHRDQPRVLTRSNGQGAESRRAHAVGGRGPGLRGAVSGAHGIGPARTADSQARDPGTVAEVPPGVPAPSHPPQNLTPDCRPEARPGGKERGK